MRPVAILVTFLLVSPCMEAQEVLPKPKEATPVPPAVQTRIIPGNGVILPPQAVSPPVIYPNLQPYQPQGVVMIPQNGYAPAQMPMGNYRRSSMEHWQHLSPTSQGYMRPRVLLTPDGPVYSIDGRPFLFLNQEPKAIGQPGTVPER